MGPLMAWTTTERTGRGRGGLRPRDENGIFAAAMSTANGPEDAEAGYVDVG